MNDEAKKENQSCSRKADGSLDANEFGKPRSTVIYLHGLASSPKSFKAKAFARSFSDWGIDAIIPDLNEPLFSDLTISRAVDVVLGLIDDCDPKSRLLLMGSSFGGLVASFAARMRSSVVDCLCLMAPAFDMESLWNRVLGKAGLDSWKETGYLQMEHPAYEGLQRLNYGFYDNALALGTDPMKLETPALVFHGKGDDVVDPSVVIRFREINSDAAVHLLEDDHDLNESIQFMAQKLGVFLERLGLIAPSGSI